MRINFISSLMKVIAITDIKVNSAKGGRREKQVLSQVCCSHYDIKRQQLRPPHTRACPLHNPKKTGDMTIPHPHATDPQIPYLNTYFPRCSHPFMRFRMSVPSPSTLSSPADHRVTRQNRKTHPQTEESKRGPVVRMLTASVP